MKNELAYYSALLSDIKTRVRQGQLKANLSANSEMLATYWDIGKMIHERQQQEGWGKGVIPRLSIDLKNELPEEKGFSERNLRSMVRFYLEYVTIWQCFQGIKYPLLRRQYLPLKYFVVLKECPNPR